MVRGCIGESRLCLAETTVNPLESLQELGQSAGTDRNVISHSPISQPQFSASHSHAFFRRGVFHPKEIFRQRLAEATMNFANALRSECLTPWKTAPIDPPLYLNVRLSLYLQFSLPRLRA